MESLPPHDLLPGNVDKTLQRLNHILKIYTTDPKTLLDTIERLFHDAQQAYYNTPTEFSIQKYISEHLTPEQKAALTTKSDTHFVQHVYNQNFPDEARHAEAAKRFLRTLKPQYPRLYLKAPVRQHKGKQSAPLASHEQQAAAGFPILFWETIHSAPFQLFPRQRASGWILPIALASSIQCRANQLVHENIGLIR
jgi:hypothetical protein